MASSPAELILPPNPDFVTATGVIREHARLHTERDPRHVLLERPEDYVHDFGTVFFPAAQEMPNAEVISFVLGQAIGHEAFESFVTTLETSEDVRQSVEVIKQGGRVALLGRHKELFDPCVMEAGFLVAADRIQPGILPELIQGNRIFVGPIMEEMALEATGGTRSTIEDLTLLGGVFKTFPATQSTEANVKNGLDSRIVEAGRRAVIVEFRRQLRNDDIRILTMAPSGKTDVVQPRSDREGQECVLQPVSSGTEGLCADFHWLGIAMQIGPEMEAYVSQLVAPDKRGGRRDNRDMQRFMSKVMVPLTARLSDNSDMLVRYQPRPPKPLTT